MNKNRQIISELKDFFKHYDSSKAVNAVSNVMDKLVIQAKTVGPVKNPNCKFTFVQLVKLLVLHPFFSIKTPADYADSALGKLFACKKGNGSWNALITTDMGIDAKRTFELYARRWCIEVAHKERDC